MRGWGIYVAGGAVVVVLGVAGIVAWGGESDTVSAERLAVIDEHRDAARDAAAKAFFLYPPPEEPTHPTAYTEVLALEDLADELGTPAREAATQLRQEFATTLVRLGDNYWSVDGGRPFAIDYYIAARMFDPDNAQARARASMTPGEFVDLRRRAEAVDFSTEELVASAPLVALAESDEGERLRKLETLHEASRDSGSTRAANLKRLTTALRRARPKPKKAEPEPAPEVAAAEPEAPEEPEAEPELLEDDTAANPAESRVLAQQGHKEAKRGRRGEAERLFRKALELNPRNASAYYGLSLALFDRGNYDRARVHGKRAVSLSPRNAKYRFHLGDVYFKTFYKRRAKEQYERAKALGHPQAAARLARLAAE